MTVKTTITTIDLLEKRRQLNDEIVKLKQAKEPLERELKQLQEGKFDVINSKKELEQTIQRMIELSDELANQINQRVFEYSIIAEKHISLLELLAKEIQKLEQRIVDKKKEFDLLCVTIEKEIKRIGEESAKLTRWEGDLDIYRKRVEKIIQENNLNIKIILT